VNRYLLDTNIISSLAKAAPAAALVAWMADQTDDDLFITALTLGEPRRGILERNSGRKRSQLERWFSGPEGPQSLFANRILPFDEKAALIWSRLMAEGAAAGSARGALDMIVAAVAEANHCIVVTDNPKHFAGLKTVTPTR
jgi:predicted nucleic acid-binding protein